MNIKVRHVLQIDVIYNCTLKTGERGGDGMTWKKNNIFPSSHLMVTLSWIAE